MQEGSTELGAGHEDAVGQEEVAEECLCRVGTWGQVGLQRSSPLSTGTGTAGVSLTQSYHEQGTSDAQPL